MLLIAFLTCLLIQCLFFITFTLVIRKQKSLSFDGDEGVSVVIALRNEAENLIKLLPELEKQTHKKFEIILVNDRSTDDSEDIIKNYNAGFDLQIVNINSTPDHINSKKYAITLGVKKAKYDVILLTDADCIPTSQNWIRNMASASNQKEFILGVSFYRKERGLLNYFIRFETLLTAILYVTFAKLGKPYMGVGRNLAYRKSLFLRKKGFNGFSRLVGGDDDLFVNKYATGKNTAIVYAPDSQTLSNPKHSIRSFLRQKTRHLGVGKYYKFSDKVILGIFSLTYLLTWLLLPWLLLCSNELYLILGSFFIRVLIMYLALFRSTKSFGVPFNVVGLLFLDLIFVFYYCYTSIVALFSKRITWN